MSIDAVMALLLQYKYLLLPPLSLFAQPLVGMTSGVLARLGIMDIWIIYTLLVVTAVLGDMAWYWIGYRFGDRFAHRFGRFVGITPEHIAQVKIFFHRYHASILLISKLTNGFGFALATLFTAGLTRVPFGRFVVLNIIGEAIWSAMIIAIGYFFGHLYLQVNDMFGRASLIAGLLFIVVIGFGITQYLKNRLVAESTSKV